MTKLNGKVALVTGGSSGIGRAVAAGLAGEGARIMIAARNAYELKQASDEMCSAGAEVSGLATDVADKNQVEQLIDKTIARFSRIDVLVNAAGVQGPIGPLWKVDPAQWRRALDVNLYGTMLCCRSVVPHMITAGGGKIINFSGGGATGPRSNFSAYAASKAAVVRMTETLAEETRRFNIDVNAVAPGIVNTRMLDGIAQAGVAAAGEHERIEALRKDPAGFVSVEVPVGLVVFLASEESGGLSGKLISAPYDDWETWDQKKIRELSAQPLLTLRRIDRHTLNPITADAAKTAPDLEPIKLNGSVRGS